MSNPVYTIGIDLGTTNSVVAFTKTEIEKGKKPEIHVMDLIQLVDAGTLEKRNVLPSFILVPGKHDVAEDALKLPWNENNDKAVGEFARERGAEIPHRLVSSSKSWLCHTLIDRNKPVLPWDSPDEDKKMSPVEAASEMLKHIRDAWNYTMAADDKTLEMEKQDVLLTVPASFDAVARDLTVKAAEMAGLANITLLEEPQAAFYAWIESMDDKWRENVQKGDMILVCDIGGGTSDFSLIKVSEEEGDLALDRIAVGDHLLVGGDNMDLALAYSASQKLSNGKKKKPDAWQMRGLWHACRKAKETLLSDPETKEYPITLLGRGKSLIGGTKKTKLTAKNVEDVIVDGFFPKCDKTAVPENVQRAGIQEAGLAYESDPAITRHLAHFLSRSKELPTAVLFNGGVMKAEPVRKRVLDTISSWLDKKKASVREIQTKDFDLTVARGAAYYGLARKGTGIRIRGGLNKTYYIGVAASLPAVPGMPVPIKALCVAPFGMEEGSQANLPSQEFVLVVGEPVKFDFLGSSTRLDDNIGTVIDDWEDDIEEITTMETTLDGETGTSIPVILEIRVTEIGTLELWCVSKTDKNQRWKLEFNVREKDN
ncbi:Chaperone Hsp70 family protein [Desulfonema limicola]|uniref:Chaperone Hsp70 family protein n=1 Tax=Desulfonema limicola TaxID=45656 RepID=A0A975BA32_9BACT|nr:Hsp70 family protein [Desulfonema limicola]QTA81350.1 Chaperone Hsp70 family protein [Desulfonema limicola]